MQIIEVDSEDGGKTTSIKVEEIKLPIHKCPEVCPDGLLEFMEAEEILIAQGLCRCRTQIEVIGKALNTINAYLSNLEDRYKYLSALRVPSTR